MESWRAGALTGLRHGSMLALGALLVGLPLILLVFDPPAPLGQASPVSPWTALTDTHFSRLLWISFRLAAWTTACALLVGVPYGLWLAWTRSRAALPLAAAHLLPLCLPPYLTALAWSNILGRQGLASRLGGEALGAWTSRWFYGEPGVVLTMTVALAPVVTLLTAGFARRIDPSRVEAGLIQRGWLGTIARIVLPLAAPGIAAAALLVFVLTLGEMAVPQLLRVPVYSTAVFGRLADLSFQPGEALALSLPMVALSVLVATAITLVDSTGHHSRGVRMNASVSQPRGFLFTALLGVALLSTIFAILPLGELLHRAVTGPGGGRTAVAAAWPALSNSLSYAGWSAAALTVLAAVLGVQWSASPRTSGILAAPLLLGLVLPAGVYALALVTTWNRPSTQWIYRADTIVVLALCGRYAYVALRVTKLGRDQTPVAWLDAARLTPVGPIKRWLTIELPLQADVLGLTWMTAFLLALRDLETTVLFYPPGGESLPVRTMTLEANAPPGLTAATAATQILVTLLALMMVAVLWRRAARRMQS